MALYMRFDNITGDATQMVGGHDLTKDAASLEKQGWISISEFKWVIDRKITTRSGAHGSTRDSKQPAVETFTVNKEADKATSQLLTSICNNSDSDTCNIIFVKTGGADHDPTQVYMQYRLSNVFITNINNAYDPMRGTPHGDAEAQFYEGRNGVFEQRRGECLEQIESAS